MPPYLRKGTPVGQRQRLSPVQLVLCTCSSCIASHVALDPRVGKLVPGQLVGRQMHIAHQACGGSLPHSRDDELSVELLPSVPRYVRCARFL
jgi:hypothetical protein